MSESRPQTRGIYPRPCLSPELNFLVYSHSVRPQAIPTWLSGSSGSEKRKTSPQLPLLSILLPQAYQLPLPSLPCSSSRAGLWGCLGKPFPQSLLRGRLNEPAGTRAKGLDQNPWPPHRRMAGMDRGHRAPQKTQDGRETKSHSQTEAESGRDRAGVSCGGGRGQSPSRPWLAHMDIPVASDGRVGSALRAPWCQCGGPSMGSLARVAGGPALHILSLLGTASLGWRKPVG